MSAIVANICTIAHIRNYQHSAASYSPPAIHNSYPNTGSYVPNVNTPQDNVPSRSSYPPADQVYSPMRSHTIGPTMNPGGVYPSPPYSRGPYIPPLQLPQITQPRSLTLPLPTSVDYRYDGRARSPDPAFPQPFYPSWTKGRVLFTDARSRKQFLEAQRLLIIREHQKRQNTVIILNAINVHCSAIHTRSLLLEDGGMLTIGRLVFFSTRGKYLY